MAVTLETVDKVVGQTQVNGPRLTFSLDRVTAREIVSARVRAECERVAEGGSIFRSPVVPTAQETMLNGPPAAKRDVRPNVDRQIAVALEAIESGRVIMLVNGAQIADLDASLSIVPFSEATFVRLVPLAGG